VSVRAADALYNSHLLTGRLRTARRAQTVKKAGKRTETLSEKLEAKKEVTAVQRNRWVEAGLEVFGLEAELEQMQATAAVPPPPPSLVHLPPMPCRS
jgi:hypothetical protein